MTHREGDLVAERFPGNGSAEGSFGAGRLK